MLLWGKLLTDCECHVLSMMTKLLQEWILNVAKHICLYRFSTLLISVI
jgi:hypothetical protein